MVISHYNVFIFGAEMSQDPISLYIYLLSGYKAGRSVRIHNSTYIVNVFKFLPGFPYMRYISSSYLTPRK